MATVVPLLLGGAVWLAPMHAGSEDWAALHSGRLMHALDRDATAAISVYEAVVDHLDPDDPLRADYLYWLGRAWFETGDAAKARDTLSKVDSRAAVSVAAGALYGRLDLDRHRVGGIPIAIDPAATDSPLIAGWGSGTAPFTVTPSAGGGPSTISWPIATEDVRAGFLAIGVDPNAGALSGVRFSARSSEVILAARVVVETFDGHTYAGVPSVLRPGTWTDVHARTSQLRPQRPGDPVLEPTNVNMVAIELAPLDPGAVSSAANVLLRSIVLDGPS